MPRSALSDQLARGAIASDITASSAAKRASACKTAQAFHTANAAMMTAWRRRLPTSMAW